MKVPLIDLPRQHATIAPEIDRAIRDVVASGQFILGSEGAAFEQEFAAYCQTAYCLGISSGTSALSSATMLAALFSVKRWRAALRSSTG